MTRSRFKHSVLLSSVLLLSSLYSPHISFADDMTRTHEVSAKTDIQNKFDVQIVPLEQSNIGAPMNGRLERFSFHDGDSFKKGDVLAHYVCLSQKAQYEKSSAELYKAEGMHELQMKLKKMGQYAKADLLANEAEVRQGHADVDNALALLNDCSVVAPYNGVVSNTHVHNYQYTQAGSPLIDIVSNEAYEASLIVNSSKMSDINIGRDIVVHVNELNKDIHATIKRISGRIDPVSRTVRVYADIKDTSLRPGMTGSATLSSSTTEPEPSNLSENTPSENNITSQNNMSSQNNAPLENNTSTPTP